MGVVLTCALVFFAALEIYLARRNKEDERRQHKEMIETLEKFIIEHDKERDTKK